MPNRDPAAPRSAGIYDPGRTDKMAAKKMETIELDTVMTPSRVGRHPNRVRPLYHHRDPVWLTKILSSAARWTRNTNSTRFECPALTSQENLNRSPASQGKGPCELAYGHSVFVEWRKRDGYRLIVGKVFEGGRGVNLEQVRRGLAWRYQQYQKEQDALDRASYAMAETVRRARRNAACGRCRKPKGCTPAQCCGSFLDQ